MTYQLNPRLLIEDGPAVTAQRIHRSHAAYRILLARGAAKSEPAPEPANDCAAPGGTIRFAL